MPSNVKYFIKSKVSEIRLATIYDLLIKMDMEWDRHLLIADWHAGFSNSIIFFMSIDLVNGLIGEDSAPTLSN